MRKVLAFGLTFSLAGATLYACSDSTEVSDPFPAVDSAAPDAKSSSFGDVFVPDAKVTGEEDGSTGATDSGPKDGGHDASEAGDASDSGVVLPPGAGNFTVVRVGVAGGILSSAAAPVFVEERALTDGTVAKTVTLPVAVAGAQNPITLRGGTGTAEGALALSSDNAYLLLAGYSSLPATAAPNTVLAATSPRVVARIDKAGAFDTSTLVTGAFDTGAPRGVASADGMSFWVGGEGGALGMTGGIHYVPFANDKDTAGTQVFNTVTNLRAIGIFGAQLYGTTQSGADFRVFSVGTGMPTTGAQTATEVPGVPATATPGGFVMLDTDATAGVDTMYVADTSSVATTGGVQKWKLAAGTWTLAATYKSGFGTGGPLFVNAKMVGTSIIVLATTAEAASRVIRFVDDGVNTAPAGITVATGTSGATIFRGVAFPAQ